MVGRDDYGCEEARGVLEHFIFCERRIKKSNKSKF